MLELRNVYSLLDARIKDNKFYISKGNNGLKEVTKKSFIRYLLKIKNDVIGASENRDSEILETYVKMLSFVDYKEELKTNKKKQWYEKYMGYCFNYDGREVVLEDVYEYEDGRKCFQFSSQDGDFICDYKLMKYIKNQTVLPK